MVLDGIVCHAERVRGVRLVVVLHVGSDRDRDVERGVVGEHRVEAVRCSDVTVGPPVLVVPGPPRLVGQVERGEAVEAAAEEV